MLFDILINLLEGFLIAFLVVNYLEMNELYNKRVFITLGIVIFLEITFLNILFSYESIFLIIQSLTIYLFACKYATNDKLENLFIALFIYVIISIINSFIILIFSIAFLGDIDTNKILSSDLGPFMIILSKILFYLFSKCIINVRKKYINKVKSRNFIFLILQICIIYFIDDAINWFLFEEKLSEIYLTLSLGGLTILTMLNVIAFFETLKNSQAYYENQLKIEMLDEKLKNNDKIMEINQEISHIKHDTRFFLELIKNNAIDNKNSKIIELVTEYEGKFNGLPKIIITGNSVIDYVLNDYIMKFAKNKIEFNYEINVKNSPDIQDIEFNALLRNGLENALENCPCLGKVKICINEKNSVIKFEIRNTINKNSMKENPELKTMKQEKGHGYGIKNMKRIVKNNYGEIFFQSNDLEFICSFFLPIITECHE